MLSKAECFIALKSGSYLGWKRHGMVKKQQKSKWKDKTDGLKE